MSFWDLVFARLYCSIVLFCGGHKLDYDSPHFAQENICIRTLITEFTRNLNLLVISQGSATALRKAPKLLFPDTGNKVMRFPTNFPTKQKQ